MWWLLIPILTGLYTGISVMLNTDDYCSFGGDTVGRHGVLFVEVGVPPAEGMPCTQVGGLLVAGSLGLGLLLLLYVAWRVGALDAVFQRGGPSERATPWEVATQNHRSIPAPSSSAEAGSIFGPLALRHVIVQLQGIVDGNPGSPVADKVEDAAAKANTALGELKKTPSDNQAAAGNIEGAIGDLEAAVADGLLKRGNGNRLIGQLANIIRKLESSNQ